MAKTAKGQDFEAFKEFMAEFSRESDRAAVILGAAKLDVTLFQILHRYLLPVATNSDELLEGDAPLGTFSARINAVYRLGLIDAEFARALHLIRRIRNSFAHDLAGSSLDTGSHRDRVKELVAPFARLRGFKVFKTSFFGEDADTSSSDFRTTLAIVSVRLNAVFNDLDPVKATNAWALAPPDMSEDDANAILSRQQAARRPSSQDAGSKTDA